MRAFLLTLVLSISLPAWADDAPPIGAGADTLPIFDAHMHYKREAWSPYPPSTVIELMDTSGVAMALVSSTPDEGTIKLWEHAPDRIVPELRPYHEEVGPSNWTKVSGMFEYLMERLEAYPHEGIGEFHLHRVDPRDEALLSQIAEVAKAKNIIIHVHSGQEPVEYLYALEPGLKIIWAHAGMSEPAEVVEAMMAKYPTLYADTSYREFDILTRDGGIDPDWRRVLIRYAERFMVGSDTWVNAQWDVYENLIADHRRWLQHLPRPIAEQIAYKTAETLFGRKIAPNQ